LHVTLTRNGTAAKPFRIHAKHGHPARFRLARHGQRQGLPGRAAAAILAAVAFAAFGSRGNAKGSRASPRPAVYTRNTGILPVFAWPVMGNAKGCPDGRPRPSWPRCTLR
jgi:hypothetical protein